MRRTNVATVPLTRWASAIAASLPDGSRRPLSIVSSLMRLPRGRRPTPEPLYASASFVTLTFAVGFSRCTTISAVIIFVSDAIGSTRSGRRRHRTSPVSRSKSRPLRGCWWKRNRSGSAVASSLSCSGRAAGSAAWTGPLATCSGAGAGRVRGAVAVESAPRSPPPALPPHPAATSSAASAAASIARHLLIAAEDEATRRRCPARAPRRASVHRVAGPVVVGVVPARERLDREHAEQEPADVREVGDAASTAGRVGLVEVAEEHLLGEPDHEEEHRRDLD